MNQQSTNTTVEQIAAGFVEQIREGKTPSIDAYCDQHPELAEEIRDLFPMLAKLERLAPKIAPNATTLADASIGDSVGPYRLTAELGRGGMAIVYDAVDERTRQTVALKIMQSRMLRSKNMLARFFREVRSTSQLHHTNIVPILDSGEDDGLHYLAMQRIDGFSLLDVLVEVVRIRENKTLSTDAVAEGASPDTQTDSSTKPTTSPASTEPEFSQSTAALFQAETETPAAKTSGESNYCHRIARIGVQVSDAIAHAHERGIFHRDVKPSNILLDNQGNAWVTDFGLAKSEDDNLTHTGDIVGTPRYMAPERLHGKFDHTSDVYSIGATLYEMLAFRPAFDESERPALLKQVEDGRTPPLRSLNADVPRDLETIVQKAMSRSPTDRYASANLLTDDLKRFLAGEPIQARPPTAVESIVRWAKLHPALASSLLALILAMAVGLSFSTWHWRRANQFLTQSRQETDRANRERERAENAEREQREQRDVAEFKALLAQKTAESMSLFHQVQQKGKVVEPQMLAMIDAIVADSAFDDRQKLVLIRLQNAKLMNGAGRYTDVLGEYEGAVTHLTTMLTDRPHDQRLAIELIKAQVQFGYAQATVRHFEESITWYQQANDELMKFPLKDRQRDWHFYYAKVLHNMGFSQLALGHPEQTERYYQQVLEVRNAWLTNTGKPLVAESATAQLLNDLAYAFLVQGDAGRALLWDHRALELRKSLAIQKPGNRAAQYHVAASYNHIADSHRRLTGRYDLAVINYNKSITINRKLLAAALLAAAPDVRTYQLGLATDYLNLAEVWQLADDQHRALDALLTSNAAIRKFVEQDQKNTRHRSILAETQYRLGDVLFKLGDTKSAIDQFRSSIKNAAQCVAQNPTDVALADILTSAADHYSRLLARLGNTRAATEVWNHCLSAIPNNAAKTSIAIANNTAAKFFLLGPQATRDRPQALTLSTQAIAANPEIAEVVGTHALALCMNGQLTDAMKALTRYSKLSTARGRSIYNDLTLALCHAQQPGEHHDATLANQLYDAAIHEWTKRGLGRRDTNSMSSLRDEVRQRLGRPRISTAELALDALNVNYALRRQVNKAICDYVDQVMPVQ